MKLDDDVRAKIRSKALTDAWQILGEEMDKIHAAADAYIAEHPSEAQEIRSLEQEAKRKLGPAYGRVAKERERQLLEWAATAPEPDPLVPIPESPKPRKKHRIPNPLKFIPPIGLLLGDDQLWIEWD